MIEAMKIFERKGYDTRIMILVDSIPHPQDMGYVIMRFSGKRTIFRSLATNDLVLHGIHNADDPRDHVLTKIRDTDGNSHKFRGAWSSRESLINKYFEKLPHIHRILVTISRKHYDGNYFSTSYAMEVTTLNKEMSARKMGWLFVPAHYEDAFDEPDYELRRVDDLEIKIPHELHPK